MFVLVSAIALSACGRGERGHVAFAGPCTRDEDCAQGLCVAGTGVDHAVCTRSCLRGDQCPEGWSCSGVTQNQVLVCSEGNGTPFGPAPPRANGAAKTR